MNKWTDNVIGAKGAIKISESLELIVHWLNCIWVVMKKNKNENEKDKEMKMKRNEWTDNHIGDEGASKISESLKVNTTLTKLDMSCDE